MAIKDRISFLEGRPDEKMLEKINSDVAILSRSVARNVEEIKDRMKALQNMIETTNGNTFMLTTHLNEVKEKIRSLAEDLSEHGIYEMEERLDNRMDALEKRLNDTRNQMKMKPDYQDITHQVRDCINKLNIEQKKHICSAIDAWSKVTFYQNNLPEKLKCMICDTKVGEFLPDDN